MAWGEENFNIPMQQHRPGNGANDGLMLKKSNMIPDIICKHCKWYDNLTHQCLHEYPGCECFEKR